MGIGQQIINLSRTECTALGRLEFGHPVHTTYNPLEYASVSHETYVRRFASTTKRTLFLGMNPGPWGMAQTGVPFGEIHAVRDWMGISATVGHPEGEHPKRPILGFECTRSEVSGRRLWGLMSERYESAECFFAENYVANYCPLIFLEETGRNRTPDKLAVAERSSLFEICDRLLAATIDLLEPSWLVGVGKFAEKRLLKIVEDRGIESVRITSIAHPSPANPAANRGWNELVTGQLIDSGVWVK